MYTFFLIKPQGRTKKMEKIVEKLIKKGLLDGKNPYQIAREVEKRFGDLDTDYMGACADNLVKGVIDTKPEEYIIAQEREELKKREEIREKRDLEEKIAEIRMKERASGCNRCLRHIIEEYKAIGAYDEARRLKGNMDDGEY